MKRAKTFELLCYCNKNVKMLNPAKFTLFALISKVHFAPRWFTYNC